jgi:hypothetical protein
VSTNWTKLVELAGVNKDNVAIVNVVDENMKDLAKQIRNWRNKLLHTNGKGWLATVLSVNAATQTYTLQSGPNTSGGSFGARLLGPGLTIDVVNSSTDLRRGSLTVNYKFDLLGQTQTFNYIGVDPGGVNGDYIRVRGLVDGAPIGCTACRTSSTTRLPARCLES